VWFKRKLGKDDQWMENLDYTLQFLFAWLAGGFVIILAYALSFWTASPTREGFTQFLTMLCYGGLLSLGFGSLGGLVGFLFGIPRQVRQSDKPAVNTTSGQEVERIAKDEPRSDSTNLEQVSDWLTKIILGAGLTQLTKLPAQLKSLGEYFKPGFHDSSLIPILIVMNSLIFGFFAGYVLTQLFLAQALKKAQDSVRNVAVVLDTAGNLERMGKFGAATATLESALASLRPETPIQTKRTLFERLTYNSLYEPAPEGFQKAIRYAEQYIQEEPKNPSARIWANLAAALGQKYRYDSEHGASKEVLEATRRRAVEAVSKAIELEPQMKGWLRTLWNPNDPTKVQSEEDDLEVFHDDPDFVKLLA
jgi:tetratricopeptide (TPR) repeat protein